MSSTADFLGQNGRVTDMTKWQLFEALSMAGQSLFSVTTPYNEIITGILQGVQRESGSGRSFIVSILIPDQKIRHIHVQTID